MKVHRELPVHGNCSAESGTSPDGTLVIRWRCGLEEYFDAAGQRRNAPAKSRKPNHVDGGAGSPP